MRRLQKQALKTEAKSTSYGRERAYKDWKRALANVRAAAEQQGQGVEQDGGVEPQLFYSDRTTQRPAYDDEEAEADGSSDEEDFDSWAGWNSDDSDFEEGTTPAKKENVRRAYRRQYEDHDVARGELYAQTAAVDRAIRQEAGKPGSSEMFQTARRTSGWDPQDPTAPRYVRRQWRPADVHDARGGDIYPSPKRSGLA